MQKNDRPEFDSRRKPAWLKVAAFSGERFGQVTTILKNRGLNTVCHAANCPNRGDCFGRGTATFLILGPICTRACTFCNIGTGKPTAPDPDEPRRVAEAAAELSLKHVVVTSVTRDDLADGGASQFASTIVAVRELLPGASVEVLTPDFYGVTTDAVQILAEARPDVFNHNLETVPALYRTVRPGADYGRSLNLLRQFRNDRGIMTKSGLMVGLGETREQLRLVFADLAEAGVSILTIGQYLAPSRNHHPVARFVSPDEMTELGEEATRLGIPFVLSAPLVRSSFHAEQFVGVR